MTAFENATKFFHACEAPEGWAGCKRYVADNAPFSAQSEPLAEINTKETHSQYVYILTMTADNKAAKMVEVWNGRSMERTLGSEGTRLGLIRMGSWVAGNDS